MDLDEALKLLRGGPKTIGRWNRIRVSDKEIPDFSGADFSFAQFVDVNLYSSKDEEFAKRLHSKMRDHGLRVWFAPEDIQGGKKLHEQIDEAIRLYDKLLLVLSPESMGSEWVATEIRRTRQAERQENRRKLFPIRLVDFEAIRDWQCFDADIGKDSAVEIREYFIPDFTNWKDHDSFEAAYARLLEDLKAGESIATLPIASTPHASRRKKPR